MVALQQILEQCNEGWHYKNNKQFCRFKGNKRKAIKKSLKKGIYQGFYKIKEKILHVFFPE